MKVTRPHSAVSFLISGCLIIGGLLSFNSSAAADDTWVPAPTWSQLNVANSPGIFQQNLRTFDDASVKMTDDPGQHSNVYVRTDIHSVDVDYNCRLKQGSGSVILPYCQEKYVQFGVDLEGVDLANVDVTINGVKQTYKSSTSMRYVKVATDVAGKATVNLGVTNKGTAASGKVIASDDYLAVYISNCDRSSAAGAKACGASDKPVGDVPGSTASVGPMTILFQDKGYYPQVKIVNQDFSEPVAAANGCDPYAVRWASGKTWDWSVFKRSWLGEYACVYVKTYQVGDTATVPYRILDIWGTPLANYPIEFTHPSTPPNCGTVRCKWSSSGESKYTNANGYVSFTVKNLNTPAEACLNQGYNDDIKETGTCALGVGMNASTGMSPESQDLFWPQFVNSLEIPENYLDFYVNQRGGLLTETDNKGKPITEAVYNSDNVKNPALPVNTTGNVEGSATPFVNSLVRATIDLKSFYNANPDLICFRKLDPDKNPAKVQRLPSTHGLPICTLRQEINAPNVTVTASEGGRVLRTCPDTVDISVCRVAQLPLTDELSDVSEMFTSQTFGYQNMSQLVFTSTKPGLISFTIDIGHHQFTILQNFTTTPSNARSVVAVAAMQPGTVGPAAKTVQFKVVDRFGNGYSGIDVAYESSGTFDSATSGTAISDANGLVSVDVSSATAGVGTLTATITNPGDTQIGAPGNTYYSIPASATSATATVNWGELVNATAPKVTGIAKVGKKLSVSKGVWAGSTPVYAYAWYSCSAKVAAGSAISSKCKAIAGAKSSSYTVPKTQVGKFIGAVVTARNTVTAVKTAFAGSTLTKVVLK